MSDPRHRHPYDCIAFLDQRWDAMTAEMRAKAVQVEAELHMRIAALTSELAEARGERDSLAETRAALTANLNALTVDVATMRAERDAARRALAEMWSAAWLLMWRAIGDSISADDWCNEWARCPSPEAFAEVTRERDALKAGKWAGAWGPLAANAQERRQHGSVMGFCTVACTVANYKDDTGIDEWHWYTRPGDQPHGTAPSIDAAKAAADAHLIAAGWFLAGGPHGAGEAK